jgi:hypothetical protein
MRIRAGALHGLGLGGQMLVEERGQLGPELLDVGIKTQLHKVSSAISAR